MSLIVKKFGGTSVADTTCLHRAADLIAEDYKAGNDVIAVVSAQGDTTDALLEKALQVNPSGASRRETDVLLSAGEQMSAALLAMSIERLGLPVVSLLGWQAGFHTDSNYSSARIKRIDTERLKSELSRKNIIIVAGFQGINKFDDITTLGRGGSDTSAVALAAVLKAARCQIYTDVPGVFTADPRKVPNARKLSEITYDEMLELASLGAQVLNNRSVEMAKKYNVELEVLSSFERESGTIVKENAKMEKMVIRSIAKDRDVCTVYITGLCDAPGIAFKVFNRLAQSGITVDLISHTAESHGKTDIMFTVKKDDRAETLRALESLKPVLHYESVETNIGICKISVVGSGMASHPGVAAKMFEVLYDLGISIQMIASSEIKISVVIDEKEADRAVIALHEAFMESPSFSD